MQKDLKEKRSCKFSLQCHLESYHMAAGLVPGLLVHKNVTGIVQMGQNEENIIKLDVSLNGQNIK